MLRLDNNGGTNSTEEVVAMETSRNNNPTFPRRKWWWMIGNKEDQFVWQQGGIDGRSEEILYKPNFEYDAEQLSSLFTSRHNYDDRSTDNGHRDNSSAYSDLTDDEFIDFVLNGTHKPAEEELIMQPQQAGTRCAQEYYSNHSSDTTTWLMKQIIQKYHECRETKRNLANTYIADRRSILPEPWIERDIDGEQSSIQMDRHGRLVRTRRESHNDVVAAAANNDDGDHGEEEDAAATESSNNDIEELELVDAAEAFWRQHKKSNKDNDRCRGGSGRRVISVSNAAVRPPLPGILQPQQPPLQQQQQQPPLPQNPFNQQHIRERSIAQQMENESRQAIERAIHRYRAQHQQRQEGDEAIFEMVHIPLIGPINDATVVPRWLRFLSFNGRQQQQQHANDNNNAGENPNQQRNNVPNEQDDHHWIDLRLALRRICFAVITVVAAFICMMLQGIPTVDFGDDGMEVDTIFLSGLMGPHYTGHHPQHHHHHHQQQQQQKDSSTLDDSLKWTCRLEDRFVEKFKRGGAWFNYWSGFLIKLRKIK